MRNPRLVTSAKMQDQDCVKQLKIGVLGIIGSFSEHVDRTKEAAEELKINEQKALKNVNVTVDIIRSPEQMAELDGMIIPGGESTVLTRFLRVNNFLGVVRQWSSRPDKYMWGTCAGLIVLSNDIQNKGTIDSIGGIDITCSRNGYGRQNESHVANLEAVDGEIANSISSKSKPTPDVFSGVFIRAPTIKSVNSEDVRVLCCRKSFAIENDAIYVGDNLEPVGVAQGNKMATTFHPELTEDLRWHAYFLQEVFKRKYNVND